MPRLLLLTAALGLLALVPASAETCLSPFVKRLDRPEKFLYVFCVDADAKDHDFLAVIDVEPESKTYGKIMHQLDLGSSGNETHHFGFTDDRTHIWGCSLFSSNIFLIDVADNPAKPKLVKVLDDVPEKTGLTGPHSPYALPGRMLLSFLAGKDGGLPAGLAEFTNDGKFIRTLPMPKDAPYGYDVAIKPDLNRMVTSSFTPLRQLQEAVRPDGLEGLRQGTADLGLPRAQGAAKADDRRRPAGVPLVAEGQGPSTASPTAPSTTRSGSGRASRA